MANDVVEAVEAAAVAGRVMSEYEQREAVYRAREDEEWRLRTAEQVDVQRHRRALEDGQKAFIENGKAFNAQHLRAVEDGARQTSALERIAAALERLASAKG